MVLRFSQNPTTQFSKSRNRIEHNSNFQLIEENAKWIDSRSEENTYSLNIEKFKIAQNAIEEKAKKYKPISQYKNALRFSSLPYEVAQMNNDNTLKEKRERWHEALSKDIYVEEALNVLDDLQSKPVVKKTISTKLKKDKIAKS